MTGMKTREQGKWGPQLIYSFSYHNERPGVWMAVILVSLFVSQSKAEELHCKPTLATIGLPLLLKRITGVIEFCTHVG